MYIYETNLKQMMPQQIDYECRHHSKAFPQKCASVLCFVIYLKLIKLNKVAS